jgi:hypothetical protein
MKNLIDLVEIFPDKNWHWDWYVLSRNPAIT